MGQVIKANAEAIRIEEHVRRALRAARARGGQIAEAAEARLGPATAAIDTANQLQKTATETEAIAWETVLAEDEKSDAGIGRVRDAMWNALGRPRISGSLDHVFPGGVATYTSGDPRQQPMMMQVLRSRILSASVPQWSKEACEGWAAEIDALRAPYQAAVDAHRPTEAPATVAHVGYRTAVRAAHARLSAFKRDLRNLGLSEPQIHEIIPDASTSATTVAVAAPAPVKNGGGTPAPSSA
jgi:hypothetical protein